MGTIAKIGGMHLSSRTFGFKKVDFSSSINLAPQLTSYEVAVS